MDTFTIDLPANPVMRIFLDTANVSEVDERIGTGLIDGVTTNPSLILKSGNSPLQVYNELAQKFPQLESISAEVVADNHVDMIKQALDFYTIGKNITIKLPCTPEGLRACAYLSSVDNTDGLRITTNVTLIFSVAQAIMAAKAGATYVSPFVGRLDDVGGSGVKLIQNISDTYKLHGVNTKILAASLRDVPSVSRCYMSGADVVTMPATIFDRMYCHFLTDTGLDTFNKDHQAQQQ